jgi:putative NIF3 family GTP cyclohydrolase 1 type 2
MKLKEIYQLAVKEGIKADPRTSKQIEKILEKENDKFDKLKGREKKEFDKERLKSPYSDTRIHFDNGTEVKKVLVGIDIDVAEMLLAKELGADTVICHHPLGPALSRLDQVMDMQADVLEQYGIPINIAESLIEKRISEVSRGLSPANHYQVIDAAKLLDIKLINIHTPADNLVYRKVKDKIEKDTPETIEELIKLLKSIPEYRKAAEMQMGPEIFVGSPERRTGKIAVTEITGGTSGSKDIYEKMSQYGIGTVVGMHMEEESRKNAEKHHINVVIAGHMASDSVGVNLFLKKLKKEKIDLIPAGGLITIK